MKISSTHYYIYIAMLAAMSASCADQEQFIAEAPTRVAQEQKPKRCQGIGYGFNASGSIVNTIFISKEPVIDLDKVFEIIQGQDKEQDKELYIQLFSDEARHYTDLDIYTGSTLQEISSQETRETFDDKTFLGFGKYYHSLEDLQTYKSHENIISKLQIKHIVRSLNIDMGIVDYLLAKEDLSILSKEFLKSVDELCKAANGEANNVDKDMAIAFCEKWGTHLVTMANLGGIVDYTLIIERDSCYNSKEVTSWIGEKAFGISVNESLHSQIHQDQDNSNQIQYRSWLEANGGDSTLIEELKEKGKTDNESNTLGNLNIELSSSFKNWVKSINDKNSGNDNTVIVSGKMVPYYQLFTNPAKRSILVEVFKRYLNETAPGSEQAEPVYGYIDVVEDGSFVNKEPCVYIAEDKSCLICTEYVPAIRPDRPCVVAYPLIACDGKMNETVLRAFFDSGYFLGDEDHRPGEVKWYGNDSHYEPSDSLCYNSPSDSIQSLFDKNTKSLKRIYTYWNNVRPLPNSTNELNGNAGSQMKDDLVVKKITLLKDGDVEYAKVGGSVFSRKPVKFDADKVTEKLNEWRKIYGNLGADCSLEYKDQSSLYHYLIEGGNMVNAIIDPSQTLSGREKRCLIVNNNVNSYGVMDQLPTDKETYGLARFLNGRSDIMFDTYYQEDGSNMLGLLWPKGYRAISTHPETNPEWQQLDDQALLILSTNAGPNDTKVIRAMRLGRSGTCYPFDYDEYVSSFNYSSSDYYRYAPLFFVKRTY